MYNHVKKTHSATQKQITKIEKLLNEYDNDNIMYYEYLSNQLVDKMKYITKSEDRYFDFRNKLLEDKYYTLKLAYTRNYYNKDTPPNRVTLNSSILD